MRQQALVPIPVGPTLATINDTLLAQMDARLETKRDAAGQTIGVRFAEEQRHFRLAPTAFAPEATTFVTRHSSVTIASQNSRGRGSLAGRPSDCWSKTNAASAISGELTFLLMF